MELWWKGTRSLLPVSERRGRELSCLAKWVGSGVVTSCGAVGCAGDGVGWASVGRDNTENLVLVSGMVELHV